jgi:hypothetical protein
MKILITLLLSGCCLVASAQKKSHKSLSQSVNDDGKTMTIVINGEAGGHPIDYSRTIDVTGMSESAKKALTKSITDSLGIESPTPPVPHVESVAPVEPISTKPTLHNDHKADSHISSSIHDDGKTMQVKINGQRYNKSFKYDKSFNIQGMSSNEKNAVLKHITDSLGVTKDVQLGTN